MEHWKSRPGESKAHVKNSVGRMILVGVSLIIQIAWIVGTAMRLTEYYAAIQIVLSLLAFILVLHICDRPINSAYKITWIVTILIFPLFGILIYLMFGHHNVLFFTRQKFLHLQDVLTTSLIRDPEKLEQLRAQDPVLGGQAYYLQQVAGYPLYQNTDVTFYGDTLEAIRAQQDALRKAERFIFMEYHAIEDTPGWREIEDILAEKAAAGLDVRVFYDDVGSVGFINGSFRRRLIKKGIQCQAFNPIVPVINVFMNHRDHRKITVVDGKVGFTGGYNLADEYFNVTHPYGQWKDSGLKLEGDGVRSMTAIFLEMWDATRKTREDFEPFLKPFPYTVREPDGYVAPYADSPLDDELTGENVYLNLIKGATRYLYITTPYLIISDEMARELSLAAQRGVDVKLITPGIPDKKVIYRITRSHYADLIRHGVQIYEYTPGFLHQKEFVSDDRVAVVGTINLDFRSLYLHFENACWFTGYEAVVQVRKDIEEILKVCRKGEPHRKERDSAFQRFTRLLLKLLSPLL